MREKFRVRVPGSTSNLGPGFDTLSAALGLYLTLEVEVVSGSRGVDWAGGWDLQREENLVDQALSRTFQFISMSPPGLRITMDNAIPLRRGLGSSGAAIVAGIKLAEHVAGRRLSPEEVFEIAYPLEGHPDNIAASLLGGWVISRVESGRMKTESLHSSLECKFVLAIPEISVLTRNARAILPDSYDRGDAVFNLQRCALLVHALCAGRKDLIRVATADRLHQSYRAALVPGLRQLLDLQDLPLSLGDSVLGVVISGSGSATIALADANYDRIGDWMVSTLEREGTRSSYRVLDLDREGTHVTSTNR